MRKTNKDGALHLLVKLLLKGRKYTASQLAEEMDVDRRTIYRYIDTLRDAGFMVQTTRHDIRLSMDSQLNLLLPELFLFSQAEATTLFHAINSIEMHAQQRTELKDKLARIFGAQANEEKDERLRHAQVRKLLADAIQRKRRAIFAGYSSPSSNTKKDRLVEPFSISEDGEYVWAYEVESGLNKVFRVSRIGEVRSQEQVWLESRHHQAGYTDAFRMISFDGKTIPVRLRMKRRAYNLLLEEFPATEPHITYDKTHDEWIYEDVVSSMVGIGRFVLGLSDCIDIETPELRSYCLYFAQKHILKLPYPD